MSNNPAPQADTTALLADRITTLLANRITIHANAIDAFRARDPYTPEEYAEVAKGVSEALAVLDELERLWEALYGERPSRLDVAKAASV